MRNSRPSFLRWGIILPAESLGKSGVQEVWVHTARVRTPSYKLENLDYHVLNSRKTVASCHGIVFALSIQYREGHYKRYSRAITAVSTQHAWSKC